MLQKYQYLLVDYLLAKVGFDASEKEPAKVFMKWLSTPSPAPHSWGSIGPRSTRAGSATSAARARAWTCTPSSASRPTSAPVASWRRTPLWRHKLALTSGWSPKMIDSLSFSWIASWIFREILRWRPKCATFLQKHWNFIAKFVLSSIHGFLWYSDGNRTTFLRILKWFTGICVSLFF